MGQWSVLYEVCKTKFRERCLLKGKYLSKHSSFVLLVLPPHMVSSFQWLIFLELPKFRQWQNQWYLTETNKPNSLVNFSYLSFKNFLHFSYSKPLQYNATFCLQILENYSVFQLISHGSWWSKRGKQKSRDPYRHRQEGRGCKSSSAVATAPKNGARTRLGIQQLVI